jgi:hypothetical protein
MGPLRSSDKQEAFISAVGARVSSNMLNVSLNTDIASVRNAAQHAIKSVISRCSCLSLRTHDQYRGGLLVIWRAFEYAARAELARFERESGSNEQQQLPVLLPVTNKDVIIVPVDMARISGQEALTKLVYFVHGLYADLKLSSSEPLVFYSSRVNRDSFLEGPWEHLRVSGFWKDPRVSMATFVSQEGHPPWGWTLPEYLWDGIRQLDIPYGSAVFLAAPQSECGACRPSNWSFARASSRPLSIAIASGSRKGNAWREQFRTIVQSCLARSLDYGPGTCGFLDLDQKSSDASLDLDVTVALYGAARFCLQPTGDTPMRAGFYQAMHMGCIPVGLQRGMYKRETVEGGEPWHYANDALLQYRAAFGPILQGLTADDFRGEGRRLLDKLLAIPLDEVDAIQERMMTLLTQSVLYREPLGVESPDEACRVGVDDATDAHLAILAKRAKEDKRPVVYEGFRHV